MERAKKETKNGTNAKMTDALEDEKYRAIHIFVSNDPRFQNM